VSPRSHSFFRSADAAILRIITMLLRILSLLSPRPPGRVWKRVTSHSFLICLSASRAEFFIVGILCSSPEINQEL